MVTILQGDEVRLRPIEERDRSRLIEIRSTPEVRAWWHGDHLDQEFTDDLADDEVTRLAIMVTDTAVESPSAGETVAGLIQFTEATDPEFRHASIDIYLDPAVHRRGHATDAIRTLVDHLFGDLGHHRITIDPAAANLGAIECYLGIGFREVGVMHSYQRRPDGTWADGLLMELVSGTV